MHRRQVQLCKEQRQLPVVFADTVLSRDPERWVDEGFGSLYLSSSIFYFLALMGNDI